MTEKVEEPIIVVEKPTRSKARFVDFTVEKEEWNKYVLGDKSILKVKFVLTGAMMDKTRQEIIKEAKKSRRKLRIGFTIRSQNVFGVECPPRLRGSPDSRRYSPEELRASIVRPELDFETARETWNSYLFRNGIRMKSKISPTFVNRTSKFDSVGMPIYVIDFSIDVLLRLPEEIENILKKRQKRPVRSRKKTGKGRQAARLKNKSSN
jgi:hypothetical protein